jgi:hypothetical protein
MDSKGVHGSGQVLGTGENSVFLSSFTTQPYASDTSYAGVVPHTLCNSPADASWVSSNSIQF